MAEWSVDLSKYVKKAKKRNEKVRKIFAFLLYEKIVKRTPVMTGRARGNWLVTIGSRSKETVDYKGARYKHVQSILNKDDLGDKTIFISNNLPYIAKLEYGGYPKNPKTGNKTINGFSKRAPQGMVGVTLASADSLIKQAIKAAKND